MGRVEAALEKALIGVALTPSDGAAVELARKFAQELDSYEADLPKIGKGLLEILVELGMTPKARAAVAKGAPPAAVSGLDELRARRERRS